MFLTKDKEWRIRGGISKVPFGFEDLQSSQQRLALDRTDAINSAAPNERDTGFSFYYTPIDTRKLFRSLVDKGLKGSGDYGILGVGVYNGQTLNVGKPMTINMSCCMPPTPLNCPMGKSCKSEWMRTVGLDCQCPFLSRLSGRSRCESRRLENGGNINDERIGTHFVLYPQPFGLQAEWNWGRGLQN